MYKNLIFPTKLVKNFSAYILISGQEWGTKYRENMTAEFVALNNYISIALPLASGGVSDSINHNWESTEQALLNVSAGNISKMIMKASLTRVKSIFQKSVAAQEFKSGRTINDFAALTYGGQDFREFSFDFELIPNNATEAKILKEIIQSLKFASSSKNEGSVIKYPYFWTVRVINPKGDDYFTAKKCVINNLAINKFQNSQTIHNDGEPIQTDISISFTELYKEYQNN